MRLEKYLILNKYLLSLFGAKRISDLRDKLNETEPGFDNYGKSYFVDVLIGLETLQLDRAKLLNYDEAIKKYSERLSKNRREEIKLKYFQYLAVLFAEVYLDDYFNKRGELLQNLNSFLSDYNRIKNLEIPDFREDDLRKLAYWMATGSGKTLIMHINFWQFQKYNNEKLDNIILVTPNEGLSKQHFDEMQKSGIHCNLYAKKIQSPKFSLDEVLIIDIHKLVKNKKGSGVRIETSAFKGKNLVLIDEGHKGQSSEEQTWKNLREELAENGFLFEYSATFGQVIKEKDKDLLYEYSKAIIFDYSYKYFYEDGYGKDFYVYNISEHSFTKDYKDMILTSNLLSFYEQLLLYENNTQKLKKYLIEKPLWAFVGSKVTGQSVKSDVLQVVLFLDKIIKDRRFLENNVKKILDGDSGLFDAEGNDIFEEKYKIIRDKIKIDNIFDKLFDSTYGSLKFYEIKSAEGEIGLKVGEGNYFGVINIGDVSSFKKLLNEKEIEVESDNFTNSLFDSVNDKDSKIKVIIGAKKFIEGWNSWRVCSMGLINMGKGEGPQIIQLFGRGVRLKGENLSLKRSIENEYHIKSLETLNIFGLNADYMNTFLETIRKEDIEYEELKFKIKPQHKEKWENLYNVKTKVPEAYDDFLDYFVENKTFDLIKDEDILNKLKIDLRTKIKTAHGLETGNVVAVEECFSLEPFINILNWSDIYTKILNYKISKGFSNLKISRNVLKDVIQSKNYEVYVDPSMKSLNSFNDLFRFEELVLIILKNYIDKFYNKNLREEETKHLRSFKGVDNEMDEYTLKIDLPKNKRKREHRKIEIEKIRKLINDVDKIYERDIAEIPTLHFDRHLYTPLVVYSEYKEYIKSIPAKLNKGETKFVKKLRNYVSNNSLKDKEIFLLRNPSISGISFFQTSGYYPDFIMWIKENNRQYIIFIDPKGIRNLGNFNNEKIQLYKYLKEAQKSIKSKNKERIILDSFILSVSKYNNIKGIFGEGNIPQEEFEENHILFLEDEYVIEKLFKAATV